MRASILVETIVDINIPGSTLEEAVEAVQKIKATDLFKVKQGDAVDWTITVLGVNHEWPSLGEHGE